jgi:hypothetical protein
MTIGINKHEVGDSNPAIKPSLQPRFCDIPEELKRLPRWVVSKGKKPYCAEAINLPASVNDPDTWSSFEAAQTAYEEDGWDGIGFVFNGDGIAGVDLDKCVVDGVPSNAALEILDEIGCQYVEFSQSGTGLHAYGHVDCTTLKGRRGTYKGIKTELYTSGRFFIATGNVFRSGPLPWLNGYQSVHDQIDSRTVSCDPPSSIKTEDTEAIASDPSVSSASSVSSVSSVHLFKGCIPKEVGTRHDCIFKLARHLKADQPNATVLERKAVLSAWWQLAEPAVGTKDFDVSWQDFMVAWDGVKHPWGAALEKIRQDLPKTPPENPGSIYGKSGAMLYCLCVLLDKHQEQAWDSKPFILGSRLAGDFLGIDHRQANTLLTIFVRQGLLSLAFKGNARQASRYRLLPAAQ